MSSGSLKELSRSITASAPTLALPLPDDLSQVINAYLDKHAVYEDSDSQRLQEELLIVYQRSILDYPSRLAPFLNILRTLKPNIRGSGRLLQWWDKLNGPIFLHLGVEKGLASEARDTLLGILIYDEEEEEHLKEAKATSDAVADSLMSTWLAKSKLALEEFNDHAKFVETQIQSILLAFGKKRPKDLLTTIDKFFIQRGSRILALSLLCEFFRHQPPHLHQMLQTPLFDNLLRCLQIDTSTRSISLAMTALIMFLPHIPNASSQYLPALFNIYRRMLFWDKERRIVDPIPSTAEDDPDSENEQSPNQTGKWKKLAFLLDSEDETVPELLHYFTFLYGLYPLNFMSYIRKPQRYLRHARFPGADDLIIEPRDIQQRSEPFRQVHLMHPNFFMLTIDSELTDKKRWQKSSAPDVVAECMALYVPSEDGHEHAPRLRGPVKKVEQNADIPDQPLLDSEPPSASQSRATSWRDTRSTAVVTPEGYRPSSGLSLHRKLSQTSQSMPSDAESPILRPLEHQESPTIQPQRIGSPPSQLSDMPNTQISTRGSLYQAVTNDSVGSLPASGNNVPSHVNAFLDSLTRDTIPRSPSLRPTTAASGLKVAYLQREIQLLKNDLNFERYLKQQHLSHIGKIHRQQIREARLEAETQHLLNYNRGLKAKFKEAKKVNTQLRKETDKSKTHARKWEADLTAKLRVLREEQKKWNLERERLVGDLTTSRESNNKLQIIIVEAERRATDADQTVKSVKSNLDELERLRKDVDGMSKKIVKLEVGAREGDRAKEREEAALNRAHLLEMEILARDSELAKARASFEAELENIRSQEDTASFRSEEPEKAHLSHVFLDTAMAASRHRINELQMSYNHLLKRYTRLQAAYSGLREQVDAIGDGDEPLLGGSSPFGAGHGITSRRSEPDQPTVFENGSCSPFPQRPGRSDTLQTYRQSPVDERSPTLSGGPGYHFQASQPYGPSSMAGTWRSAESGSGDSHAGGVPKIKPQSDVRVFGRGGVQNIGKKEGEKKDRKVAELAAKEAAKAEAAATEDAKKEEKKSVGRG
ncbi:uncharacterized protein L3040_005058 [Drepanopeziza brunnea f. sp. 'multigermtubi']|uniref:Tuberous sclerosis 1 n=1 Tax=Marssonina brunnea f. sp. multigermtubi (strain MB_m1) TaxID=1072389 RepID=K1WIH6_MARBU|nr:tuberous sclerosis 1 [Drepanopeziza brunnea f. sp. 'multigermtubi' MB_m1]EKD17455.1 tuberous sclerosis 1 [Drepanopeziza brunnea f. sp. 'multigermtubi' MB_m1]KAJ5042515.1 hypothetical protein L3040_005058 [Drepanopeziza brunnea f. sp. 'multigermtubi']